MRSEDIRPNLVEESGDLISEIIGVGDGKYDEFKINPEEFVKPQTDPFPNHSTLRVSEVAEYYGVTERTVHTWIEHGHLKVEFTPGNQKRVTKESFNYCRYNRTTRTFM